MFRTLILVLALAAPALAQRGEEYPPYQPPLVTRQLDLLRPQPFSLANQPRVLGTRVDTGLVFPRPPLESDIDMEAVLREFLPDEETLQRDEVRLRPTVQRMQGLWRVEKMTLDGIEVPPSQFSGMKYFVQGQVIMQSETAETWNRIWPSPPFVLAPPAATARAVEPGAEPKRVQPAPVVVMPLGPAAVSRPAGATRREDPRQEEGVRMNMLYQGEGMARVYWWNRYGETADPHMSRNRPSLRVSLPTRGDLRVSETTIALEVRGIGLRTILPGKFHRPFALLAPAGREEETPLEPDRKVAFVLVRDEAHVEPLPETRQNIIPTLRRVPLETGQ